MASGLSVDVKGLEKLNQSLSSKPLRSSLRLEFTKLLTEYQKYIKTVVEKHYSILENIDKVASREIVRGESHGIIAAKLHYRYKKVPLSSYPVHQYRVTVKKQTLMVHRYKKGAFHREIVPETAWATYVKVKKQWKLVVGKHGPDRKGRAGFMGWLHTGKLGSRRFRSSGIYERLQQKTWEDNERLPVVELYGPAFTQILSDPAVQADIMRAPALQKLENFVNRVRI